MKISEEQCKAVNLFNEKVRKGLIQTETIGCLCNNRDSLKISEYDRYGLWSPVVICKRCGLIFASPRLNKEEYSNFYASDEYRKIYEGENEYLEAALERYNNYGQHIFEALSPLMTERNLASVLEFGCAGGWNLLPFANYGYEVIGYDYSPSLVKLGRSKGLNLVNGSLNELSGKYDVIIINHVMEHFTDLEASLKKLCNHLQPAGLLYIGVPNIDNFGIGQLQNAHTYYFTPRTLKYYLATYGLKLISMGPAEKVHIYAICTIAAEQVQSEVSLENEFSKMMRKIQFANLKSRVRPVLNKIGVLAPARRLFHYLSGKSC